MKYLKRLACALLCISTLTGCTFLTGGDDLLQAPKASRTFLLLEKQLDAIMGDHLSYTSPLSGSYRNTVVFEDINNDGEDEALAFLRENTGGQIYVYAFQLMEDDYKQIGCIEGQGTSLGSVSFMQLPEGRGEAVVLTWALSGDVGQGLTVCSLENNAFNNILETTYTDYTVCDMDEDEADELLLLSYGAGNRNLAQIYDYKDGAMSMLSQTDANQNVQSIASITSGMLNAEGRQAIFVDNKFDNDNGMQTDIYVLDHGTLHNLALSADVSTYRSVAQYYSDDVNDDGIIEVPILREMPRGSLSHTSTQWIQEWYVYDLTDLPHRVSTTYTSLTEEWSLTFPESWRDNNVTATIISGSGVNETEFASVDGGTILLTIFVFTGKDHTEKGQDSSLIPLAETNNISYAAALGNTESDLALDQDELKNAFGVTQTQWR